MCEGEPILYIQRKGRTDKNEIVVLHANTLEWLEEYIAGIEFPSDPAKSNRSPNFLYVRAELGEIEMKGSLTY